MACKTLSTIICDTITDAKSVSSLTDQQIKMGLNAMLSKLEREHKQVRRRKRLSKQKTKPVRFL